MLRRTFLQLAAAVVPSWLLPMTRRPEVSHPRFGRYIRHEMWRHEDWQSLGPEESAWLWYINFPVGIILKVEFESGVCRFMNFNASRRLERWVNTTSGEILFQNVDWTTDIVLADHGSTVSEIYNLPHPGGTWPAKFSLCEERLTRSDS